MYVREEHVNGLLLTQKYIILVESNGKKNKICLTNGGLIKFKKFNVIFEEVFKEIASKNQNMLLGYTAENKKILKEKYNIKI